ncbi:MAG: flagellar hook-associated protein 3 [Limnohabitans sp.]|nr:flagellar hook-associated protein 3 [Limnohabitans sp.]
MKISTHLLFERATKQMTTSQNNLAKSQAQLAQGKQIINPSDAPDQASTVQRLKSILTRQESYQTALNTVQNRLQGEDSTLSSVSDLLIRAKEVAVQANNDTLSPDNRRALGVELQVLRDQMLSLANTKDTSGNYLFAGSKVTQPPFVSVAGGSPQYVGDQTRMSVMVGENRTMPINRTGTDAFVPVNRPLPDGTVQGVGFFNAMDDLIKGVNTTDRPKMQGGLSELDSLLGGLSMARAKIGSGLKGIDQQTSVIEDTVLNLKTTLSSVEDLDYASAITKMNQQMLSLEAAQSSFAKISQLSLFNYIK